MRRFIIGWELAKSSWVAIADNKRLMIFPLLALIGQIVVLVAYSLSGDALQLLPALEGISMEGATLDEQILGFGALFVIYFVFNTVTIFFNVALISCAGRALSGRPAGVIQGFWDAMSRMHFVMLWAAISSSVSIIFNILEQNKKIGAIVHWLLGAVWGVLTYLVLPVMVFEKVNPFRAIGRSKDLIFKSWGEGLGGTIGLGAITFLFNLPGFALLIYGIIASEPAMMIVACCWFVLVALWSATAGSIVTVAVYATAAHKQLKTDYFSDVGGMFYMRDGTATLDPHRRQMDNKIKGVTGGTPLHDAAAQGHVGVVEVMLKRGANAFARDEDGRTAYDRARSAGHDEVADYLENWMNTHSEDEVMFDA